MDQHKQQFINRIIMIVMIVLLLATPAIVVGICLAIHKPMTWGAPDIQTPIDPPDDKEKPDKPIEPPVEPTKPIYKVSFTASDGGRIIGQSNQEVTEGENSYGVTALPDNGYMFIGWSDGLSQNWRQAYRVDSDVSYTAYFARACKLHYSATEGGYIFGYDDQTVRYGGDAAEVWARPEYGYVFVKWSDGVVDDKRTDTNVTADANIYATFERRKFTVNYVVDSGGYIDGDAVQQVELGKNSSSVTAVPDDDHVFVRWSDWVTDATRSESEVDSNIELRAIFEPKKFTVKYETTEGGVLKGGECEQIVNIHNNAKRVSAHPLEGYEFIGWSDGDTYNSRYDVDVTSDIHVTAIFKKITVITVEYIASIGGYVDGDVIQSVEWGGSTSEVTAIADTGYKFKEWIIRDGNDKKHITGNKYINENLQTTSSTITIEAVFAYDNPQSIEDLFTFNISLDGKYYQVKARDRNVTEMIIPNMYNALLVAEILDNGFSNSRLERIDIPDSVTVIGRNAFANCKNLKQIDGMRFIKNIGDNAFALCESLERIVLPDTLISLGTSVFRSSSATVYTRLTEEQLNEMNPAWENMRNDGAKTVYIGNGDIPSADDNNEVVDYEPDVIVNEKTRLYK